MAEEKKDVKMHETAKGILGKNAEKVGSFQESTGGGTPLAKGEKLKDHPEAKRVMQPRDDDGKFTYNSVNGKELKYGPSRGETVPPILRGVELKFCAAGTKLKLETEEGKAQVRLMTISLNEQEIINNFKYYLSDEGGFAGLGKGSSIKKKGRMSNAEKEAEPGIIGFKDPKTLSDSTLKEIVEAADEYKMNPYKFYEKVKPQPQKEPAPEKEPELDPNKTPSGTNEPKAPESKPSEPEKFEEPKEPEAKPEENSDVLKKMGLDDDDKDFDAKAAAEDPNAFANTPLFKSIWNTVPKSVRDSGQLKPGTLIQAISLGKFKNPAHLKNWIKKKFGE